MGWIQAGLVRDCCVRFLPPFASEDNRRGFCVADTCLNGTLGEGDMNKVRPNWPIIGVILFSILVWVSTIALVTL